MNINFPFLESFSDEDRGDFIRKLPHESYDDGAVIFERGDTTNHVYFIMEGAVKSLTFGPDGDMAFFKLRQAGDLFGYYAAVTGEPRTATMVAVGPVKLAKMGGGKFMELVLSHRELSHYMLKLSMQLLRSKTDWITGLITRDARTRVAAELIDLSRLQKTSQPIILGRLELAAHLGITRETLTRHLSFFSKQKIIKIIKNKIHILNLEQLQYFAQE